MGVRVEVREGESLPEALRRFRKAVHHASVMYELNWHRWHITRGQDRRARKGLEPQRSRAVVWASKRRR